MVSALQRFIEDWRRHSKKRQLQGAGAEAVKESVGWGPGALQTADLRDQEKLLGAMSKLESQNES